MFSFKTNHLDTGDCPFSHHLSLCLKGAELSLLLGTWRMLRVLRVFFFFFFFLLMAMHVSFHTPPEWYVNSYLVGSLKNPLGATIILLRKFDLQSLKCPMSMILNHLWWWGFSSGILMSVKSLFIIITHWFTLSASTCQGLIYEFNKSVWKLLVLDRNTWYHITVCKLIVLRIVIWIVY